MNAEVGWHYAVDQVDEWEGFNDSGIETFSGEPIRHLAREVIQNSIDAKKGDEPVIVKFRAVNMDTSDLPDLSSLRKTFAACLVAANSESPKAVSFFEKGVKTLGSPSISCLIISDSNTTGVPGPCEQGTFYHTFMKAKGTSKKAGGAEAVGSFGIGKFAPYAVSGLRTVIVSTVFEQTDGSHEQLTQGKSILMSHKLEGEQRKAVGYYGVYERCQPVTGQSDGVAKWLQQAPPGEPLATNVGTRLTILGFEATK